MTAREQLLKELEQTSEELIEETLSFLRSVKAQQKAAEQCEESSDNSLLNLLAEFDEFAANMPLEECKKLPSDGAAQLNHYLYGSPKQ